MIVINSVLRGLCLAVYLAALARLADWLPPGVLERAPQLAAALLLIHLLELLLAFRHVRRYRGPLVLSIALTLLFGLLHWKPLADRRAESEAPR